MHIVATSVEPEYVRLEDIGHGALTLTFDLARFAVTELHNPKSGSLQVNLLAADVDTITRQLGEITMKRQGDEADAKFLRKFGNEDS